MRSENLIAGCVCCGMAVGIPMPNVCSGSSGGSLLTTQSNNSFYRCLILLLNVLLTPILLILYSLRIYFYPCAAVVVGKLICGIIFTSKWFSSCFMYTDNDFPPSERSIGKIESDRNNIVWIRLSQLEPENKKKPCLFDGISVDDICQGSLGDCWILAAFAALCDKSG